MRWISLFLALILASPAAAQVQGVKLDTPVAMPAFGFENELGERFTNDSLKDQWELLCEEIDVARTANKLGRTAFARRIEKMDRNFILVEAMLGMFSQTTIDYERGNRPATPHQTQELSSPDDADSLVADVDISADADGEW